MPPQGLNPGDRVVDLGALAISAAVATGAVASAWILWLIKKNWLALAGSLVAGSHRICGGPVGGSYPLPDLRRHDGGEGRHGIVVVHYSGRFGRRRCYCRCCWPSRVAVFWCEESGVVVVRSCH